MSKDKGSKNTKKSPAKTAGKHVSDYKAENKSAKDKNKPSATETKTEKTAGESKKSK